MFFCYCNHLQNVYLPTEDKSVMHREEYTAQIHEDYCVHVGGTMGQNKVCRFIKCLNYGGWSCLSMMSSFQGVLRGYSIH